MAAKLIRLPLAPCAPCARTAYPADEKKPRRGGAAGGWRSRAQPALRLSNTWQALPSERLREKHGQMLMRVLMPTLLLM